MSAERVAELDLKDLTAATSEPSGLADLVARSATEAIASEGAQSGRSGRQLGLVMLDVLQHTHVDHQVGRRGHQLALMCRE